MRTKFKLAEREAFTIGTAVEWRNGGHWHPGTVRGEFRTSDSGWQSIAVENHDTTKTIHKGQIIHASPTYIRLPAKPDQASDIGSSTSDCNTCNGTRHVTADVWQGNRVMKRCPDCKTGTCQWCLTVQPITALEPFNPAGNLACRNTSECQARMDDATLCR